MSGRTRSSARWIPVALTVGMTLNGLRLRARADALTALGAAGARPDDADDADDAQDAEWALLAVEGLELPPAVQAAAQAWAQAEGLQVLDLVPTDLPIERALDLVRSVDPATYRADRLLPGRGALQATLVRREVLARAEIEPRTDLDPVAFARITTELKKYAPTASDLVVVDGLHASAERPDQRLGFLQGVFGGAAPLFVGGPIVQAALLGAGLVANPPWGLAALAVYGVQPFVVFGGTAVQPRDLGPATPLVRWPQQFARSVSVLFGRWRPEPEPGHDPLDREMRRLAYEEELAGGVHQFFERRRDDCPMCGATVLHRRVTTGDLLQHKPGRFVLDECGACGHVFQNPRLSLAGLDFYYRDFYDGLGEGELELLSTSGSATYRARAEMLTGVRTPRRWLDVGGGHSHFSLIGAEVWPDTRFDGLDLSEGVDQAARRGWIQTGYRGLFPELAPDIAGAYDVVSMHHYLEHTRDPGAELDAAFEVLEPGGHLLIEVPDPSSVLSRLLGPLWGPWFQPQHQHFLPVANLISELEDRGFDIVDLVQGPAHQPGDLAYAMWLVMQAAAPRPDRPWLPAPSPAARVGRAAVFAALGPLLIAALVLDKALAPLNHRIPGTSNAYRVLARKPLPGS